MAKELILVLPLPPSLNQEKAQHWATKRHERRYWIYYAWATWCEAGYPKFEAVEVTPHFYVRNLRDEDNNGTRAMKAIIDGLKGHLIPDDSPKHLRLARGEQHIDRRNPRLELHIKAREQNGGAI